MRTWIGCGLEWGCGLYVDWRENVDWTWIGVRTWIGCGLDLGCGLEMDWNADVDNRASMQIHLLFYDS